MLKHRKCMLKHRRCPYYPRILACIQGMGCAICVDQANVPSAASKQIASDLFTQNLGIELRRCVPALPFRPCLHSHDIQTVPALPRH